MRQRGQREYKASIPQGNPGLSHLAHREGSPELNKATVQAYISELKVAGNGAGGINQRLAVIRKLMQEAADNMVLDLIFLAVF